MTGAAFALLLAQPAGLRTSAEGAAASPAGSSDPLVDQGSFRDGDSPPTSDVLRIVSLNLHGPTTERIDDLVAALKNAPPLREAGIFALQEVNRDHEGSGNTDIARLLARELGLEYAYAVEIEHEEGGGVRGLSILSRYPLRDVERVQLPVEGPGGRRRIALGVTVRIGSTDLRLYTTHLETRISVDQREAQIRGVLEASKPYWNRPLAIVGDFNTYHSAATERMFSVMRSAGFECPLRGDKKTFQRYAFVRMKLDWVWVRNLSVEEADIESDIVVSDHRPLWFDIDWRALAAAAGKAQRDKAEGAEDEPQAPTKGARP